MMKKLGLLLVFSLLWLGGAEASTLADVKARGKLLCGVNQGLQGFAAKNAEGQWAGFDVDFCRAVAAATLGDGNAVEFVPLDSLERFDKLKSGAVDLLARNTTWTMERETKIGIRFVGISYHDGQGFMVKKLLGVTNALNLAGAAVCFLGGTTTQANVEDYFREKEMKLTPIVFDKVPDLITAFNDNKCDTYTADISQLYATRLKLAESDESMVLPDAISKEPLGPAVRQGDEQWLNIVRWTLFALINAEEEKITASGVDELKAKSKHPAVRRLLGAEGTFGADLGLDADWAARAIKAVGNYGEIFNRNVGKNSPLAIERGLNALWNQGGLLYAPPVR